MASRSPSLTALTGPLAVTSFQIRERRSDLARKIPAPDARPAIASDVVDQIKDSFGGSPSGAALTATVVELLDMLKGTALEKTAKSWIASVQNTLIALDDLARLIGEETLRDLSDKTGIGQLDLLAAQTQKLSVAITAMTPHCRFPSIDEAGNYV